MTGTSIDACDAALVRVRGTGLAITAELVRAATVDLGGLGAPLRALSFGEPMRAGDIARLAREFALVHARAVREACRDERPDLVAVHGQTVFHAPPISWQLFNPWPLAEEIGAPVVFDLRGADLARGGQGAPITPIADWVLFRAAEPVAVINLGGFCNVTVLPGTGGSPSEIRGFDVCACNHVLDSVARAALGAEYDADGAGAASGKPDLAATGELLDALRRQSREGRSLGSGDEAAAWVKAHAGRVRGPDLARSACEAVGAAIAERVRAAAGPGGCGALVAGGGAKNRALLAALSNSVGKRVETTSARGIPVDTREAACMAVLGAMCADRVPITLPRVTGVSGEAPIAGCWAGGR